VSVGQTVEYHTWKHQKLTSQANLNCETVLIFSWFICRHMSTVSTNLSMWGRLKNGQRDMHFRTCQRKMNREHFQSNPVHNLSKQGCVYCKFVTLMLCHFDGNKCRTNPCVLRVWPEDGSSNSIRNISTNVSTVVYLRNFNVLSRFLDLSVLCRMETGFGWVH
jgi:hypothetical protein